MKTTALIIGAGPAGLVAVTEFIQFAHNNPNKNFQLHVIEKRPVIDRRQKIIDRNLRGVSNQYQLLNWEEYTRKTFNIQDITVSNALSKDGKLLRKFDRHKQQSSSINPLRGAYTPKNFSIKELQLALLAHIEKAILSTPNLVLHWHTESQVTKIDFTKHQAQIVHNNELTTVEFNHILNCEGSKGEVTTLLNHALNEYQPESIFVFSKVNFPSLFHGAVRLKLTADVIARAQQTKLSDYLRSQHIQLNENELLEKFAKLGYAKKTLPTFFIIDDNIYKEEFIENPELRLFVASEIPYQLYQAPDDETKRAKLIEWSILIASLHLKLPEEFFEFDNKGETEQHKINAISFNNELKYCQQPAIQLKDDTRIFLVGDACLSNFYPVGYSSLFALNQACTAVKLICCPGFSIEDYNKSNNFTRNFLLNDLDQIGKYFNRNFTEEYQQERKAFCL